MKRLLASVMCAALVVATQPIPVMAAAGARQGQNLGSLAGTAQDANKAIMSGVKVQLRNADTGALVDTTTSAADGKFSFTGLPVGNYVVEIVDASGKIVGSSESIAVAAGAAIVGITVASSAAGAAAAAAAAGATSFFASTAGILTGVAVAGGLAAVVAVTNDASPSGG